MLISEEFVKVEKIALDFRRAKPGQRFDTLANVTVNFYGLEILGCLQRVKTDEGKWFYFYCMPHFIFKGANGKQKKKNLNNWPHKANSDEFQRIVIDALINKSPQIFHEDYKKETDGK